MNSGPLRNNNYWGSYVHENGLTLWDIVLYPVSDKPWCDIEQAIKDWIVPASAGETGMQRAEKIIGDYFDNKLESAFKSILLNPESDSLDDIPYVVAKYVIQGFDQAAYPLDHRSSSYTLLFDELKRLELAFAYYLTEKSQYNSRYQNYSLRLFEGLSKDLWDADDTQSATSVLNFNYTDPFPGYTSRNSIQWVNVHGSLASSDIIFGIDGKELMNDVNLAQFTKTYRLLSTKGINQGSLIHTKEPGGIDNSTDLIKFFGHSLGEADYSYFQALFDGVDLYESHTRLIFYYCPYGNLNDAQAQQEMFKKVTLLITHYADTMVTNPEHGKNLMHKLLLEGRLSVRNISDLS